MPSSGLRGSFPLTQTGIAENITKKSPGAYALGYTKGDSFYIDYIGRSDVDVANRLKDHIGKYSRFKFEYYSSAKAAFEKECRLFHDWDPKDNNVHPARPSGSEWKCPVCRIFD